MDPLAGGAAHKMMGAGLEYMQRIHVAIREIAAKSKVDDPMELCARVVKILDLPEVAVNPLIAKSFVSHLISDGSIDYSRNTCPHRAFYDADNFYYISKKSITIINGAD